MLVVVHSFFLPVQFSWKGNPCLQEYEVKSLNDSLVILKNTGMEHSMLLENGKHCDDDKGRRHIVRFAVIITYISSRCFSGSVFLKHKVIYFHSVSMKV